MPPKVIRVAGREMRRLVNSAVGRSFLKTVTELFTNADSILKDKAGVPHATGLVQRMLDVQKGQQLDTSALKQSITRTHMREIRLRIWSAGANARRLDVIDAGTGMTKDELLDKFGTYASAKAMGQRTRSLFGRGALDVLLAHEDSLILSVKNGRLATCKVYWDKNDPVVDVNDEGAVTDALLKRFELPKSVTSSGTVVRFKLKPTASIPNEDRIMSQISRFYMLRLIAADPNTRLIVERKRGADRFEDTARFDFPIGSVIGRFHDSLSIGSRKLPVDILVVRSNEPLQTDPVNIERRENGLIFVDDNDAVLDLTLLPDYDKEPGLRHIFGVVRVGGFRDVLEARLEDETPEAVLTETRDGFNKRSDLTQALFSLVLKHVKPLYDKEVERQRKGSAERSQKLNEKVNNVLKLLNHFNSQETDEQGGEEPPKQEDPIYFSAKTLTLHTGHSRHVSVFVNPDHVPNGELVLIECNNPEIVVEPDSEIVSHRRKKHQRIELTLSCSLRDQQGVITAVTLDTSGKEVRAILKITNVIDPPIFQPPANIEFASGTVQGQPGRRNRAVLVVNLAAFVGMPEITFAFERRVGDITFPNAIGDHTKIKVASEHIVQTKSLARVPIAFDGTAWGQHAELIARAKVSDGTIVFAKCHLRFERPEGSQKFNDFRYVDFDRSVLGEVAGDKMYINANYGVHHQVFGKTEAEFNQRLESDSLAQLRAASVLVETAVYHAATVTYRTGGKKGWELDAEDPVGSFRQYFEARRMRLEPQIISALCPGLGETFVNVRAESVRAHA